MKSSNARPQYPLPLVVIAAIAASVFASSLAIGEEDEARQKRRGPPPEAIEACAELAEGSACAFTGRRGDMNGVCFAPPRDEAVLACAPEGGPRRHHNRDEEMIEE